MFIQWISICMTSMTMSLFSGFHCSTAPQFCSVGLTMVRPAAFRIGFGRSLNARRRHRNSGSERPELEPETPFSCPPTFDTSWLTSHLARLVLHDYGAGLIPAVRVQRYTAACLHDMISNGGTAVPIIEQLAQLGGKASDRSTHDGNAERDLQRMLSSMLPVDMPTSLVPLTVRYPMSKIDESILHPIFVPTIL